MDNGNQPAFPTTNPMSDRITGGLTKREYFAVMAMQSMMQKHGLVDWSQPNDRVEQCAKKSVLIADELLKQLEL